jgi:hypothetical protein
VLSIISAIQYYVMNKDLIVEKEEILEVWLYIITKNSYYNESFLFLVKIALQKYQTNVRKRLANYFKIR